MNASTAQHSRLFARTLRVAGVVAALCAQGWVMAKPGPGPGPAPKGDGEVIVRMSSQGDISPLLVKYKLTLSKRFEWRPIFLVKGIGNGPKADKVIQDLSKEPNVLSAEPNAAFEAIGPDRNQPWAIGSEQVASAQWADQALMLDQVHAINRGAGVRIAVLDTGVAPRHPALRGKLLPGRNFVDGDSDTDEKKDGVNNYFFGHGTHVAGVVNMVAPDAQIVPLRVMNSDGVGTAWDLAEAMLYAVDPNNDFMPGEGVHVINLSLSSLTKTDLFKVVSKWVSCTHTQLAKKGPKGPKGPPKPTPGDAAVDATIPVTPGDEARCSGFGGAIVVAAAGNRHSDKPEYPAAEAAPSWLSVTSSNSSSSLSSFSNYGKWIKLAAPGEAITSSVPGGRYATWSGTSMAAPFVTGAAALLRSQDQTASNDDLAQRLVNSSRPLNGTSVRELDILAALSAPPVTSTAAGPGPGGPGKKDAGPGGEPAKKEPAPPRKRK